ncbi:unnamed protein product [Onchocerca flexuosa]|uniref:Uncharacterized protein n=1 Tax=Onchocerca flexuosa TaxID=387005 RepID=A0A183I5T3_9BILA|nr:unnamed protein product [Onchocerca flexuosa]
MSESLTKGTEISKSKIRKLHNEVNEIDLSPLDKFWIIKEKVKHLDFHAGMLETIIQKLMDLIQRTTIASAEKKKKKKYAEIINDPESILNILTSAKEAMIMKQYFNALIK